jgi:histo-blood group ABO system transferase
MDLYKIFWPWRSRQARPVPPAPVRRYQAGSTVRIGLCLIATGKYFQFLEALLESAERFFCVGHDVRIHVFTDAEVQPWRVHRWHRVAHEPWPGPTLHRYRMLLAAHELREYDFVFYCDVDTLFTGMVGEEIFGDLVATLHPCFVSKPKRAWTFETRKTSQAFVDRAQAEHYFAGALEGGSGPRFVAAMADMDAMIRCDEEKGIIPIWHDESIWNAYLVRNRPDVVLSPLYCSPDRWNVPGRKLVVLEKDCAALRL